MSTSQAILAILLLSLDRVKASEYEVFAMVDMDGHEIIHDGEKCFDFNT